MNMFKKILLVTALVASASFATWDKFPVLDQGKGQVKLGASYGIKDQWRNLDLELPWYFILSGFLFGIYSSIHNSYVLYIKKGGFDYFSIFPPILSVNIKRFLMINGAVFALYFFSGRVPLCGLI